MSDTFSKAEVITRVARRRQFTTEQLLAVNETLQPGMSMLLVAWALPEPGLPMETADE